MSTYDNILRDDLKIADGTIFLYLRALFSFEENETNFTPANPVLLEKLTKILTPVGTQKINILSIKGTCSANELGLDPSTVDFTNLPGPLNLSKAIARADKCYDSLSTLNEGPLFNGKLGLRRKNEIVQVFDPSELAILQLGDGGLNGSRTRSVEVRFSKVITLPPGGGPASTTQFRLNIGDETPNLRSLIPFTSFSPATLTMEDDGNPNFPSTGLTAEYEATTFSVGIGVGVGDVAKAYKNIKASKKAIETNAQTIFSEIVDESAIVDNVIPKSMKDRIVRRFFDTIKELLKGELEGIASFELDTNTPDPVFFTEVPYSLNDLNEFFIVALEGSIAVPMLSHNFSLAFTVGFALLPMVRFVDFSVSVNVGASLSLADAELKIIKLTQIL
jgi:hypothetical protein